MHAGAWGLSPGALVKLCVLPEATSLPRLRQVPACLWDTPGLQNTKTIMHGSGRLHIDAHRVQTIA